MIFAMGVQFEIQRVLTNWVHCERSEVQKTLQKQCEVFNHKIYAIIGRPLNISEKCKQINNKKRMQCEC